MQNNSLSETLVSTAIMRLDLAKAWFQPTTLLGQNARSNLAADYAEVKSPCRVNGRVYDTKTNMSSGPDATKLSLYDFTEPGRIFRQNGSAPEQCIYRQNAEFVAAISETLHTDLFSGSCSHGKTGPFCVKNELYAGRLANMAINNVLQTLISGNMSFANTTNFFDSFANAMTNRFRFEFGSATYNETDPNLPLGVVQGVAWQESTCVQMQVEWLLLPICLTVLTTVLMMWTIGVNWIRRRDRPVWKGSLFPLIFYGHKLESKEGEKGQVAAMARDGKLMEVSEMSQISKKTPVTFAFPDKNFGDGVVKQRDGGWFRWRGRGKKDADSLLGSEQK